MPNATEERYRGEAGRRYHEGKRAIPAAALPWVARLRAAKLQPHMPANAVVLELGAGFGWNLAELRCQRRIASDLEHVLSEDVKKSGVQFIPSTSALADGEVDVVICHHVLEHVLDPAGLLREAGRVLRNGGRLLLFVPYEKERRYLRFFPQEPNHHLFSWNVQTLGNLVTDCGFNVKTAHAAQFGYDRFAAARAAEWNLGETGFRVLRQLAHLFRPGLEVRIVAEKNQGGTSR
jgi:SAM-dependent methyltransferase